MRLRTLVFPSGCRRWRGLRLSMALGLGLAALLPGAIAQSIAVPWSQHGHNPQHTAISLVPSQALKRIHWQAPVDLQPQYTGTSLHVHYGSPLITRSNTVIFPVKVGKEDEFRIEARDGRTGQVKWTVPTDYQLPPHGWVPPVGLALTPKNRLVYPGAGGTVRYRDLPDQAGDGTVNSGRWAFYGLTNYLAAATNFDSQVKIITPLTTDRYGNVFFGYLVSGSTSQAPALESGIARIAEDGTGTWVSAREAAGDSAIERMSYNVAPALSNDHRILYVAVKNGAGVGYLLALDSRSLATVGKVRLKDVQLPDEDALLLDDGTASPTVGPDGDVYFGVWERFAGSNHARGWLRHYDRTLAVAKPSGAFGWDHTPSIVPSQLVPGYAGNSKYLIFSKYNHYASVGGDGVNRMAILDPNETMTDPVTKTTVMKEVLTIAGPTPDDEFPNVPGAVREWCVNTVAIDVAKRSAVVHSEDGKIYRWDFQSNTLTEPLRLTEGIGEAYTPTVIGVDGTVYVVANAILFAIGEEVP